MTGQKYRNKKTILDGLTFASKAEAKRYTELKILQHVGMISGLTLQPQFICIVGGVKVCTYIADFAYFESNRRVVEDVKGYATDVFRLKRRLVEALNPGLTITLIGSKRSGASKRASVAVRQAERAAP